MGLSSADIGYIIWGTSCFCGFCSLALCDGHCIRNMEAISGVYSIYLLSHFFAAIVTVTNSYIHSLVLSYSLLILLSFAAFIYLMIAMLFVFVPLQYDTNKMMKYAMPSLFVCFVIGLVLLSRSEATILLFCLYCPCAVCAYISLFVLCYWFKKKMYIFHGFGQNNDAKRLELALISGVIAGTVGMIDFVYPALAFIDFVPDHHTTLWTRTCDAILYVPLILPLIRYLDKMKCFSWYNVVNGNVNGHREQLSDQLYTSKF